MLTVSKVVDDIISLDFGLSFDRAAAVNHCVAINAGGTFQAWNVLIRNSNEIKEYHRHQLVQDLELDALTQSFESVADHNDIPFESCTRCAMFNPPSAEGGNFQEIDKRKRAFKM